MSQHHRDQRWTSFNTKRRAQLERQTSRTCIECGGAIAPGQRWEVGHIVPASLGGRPTIANTGPVHVLCNRRAGGKLAAAKQGRGIEPARRGWRA